jgi:PAS domain S-box-containing protein
MADRPNTGESVTVPAGEDPRSFPWSWLLVFLALLAIVIVAGILFMQYSSQDALNKACDELNAVADLKADEIASWRRERLSDARIATGNPSIPAYVEEALVDPAGVDSREELLAATREVPDSPWFIVSKIDKSEAYATFSWRSHLALIVTFLVILALGLLFAFFWSRRRQQHYRQKYQFEETLRKSEERYRSIVDNTIEGIWTVDEDAMVTFVNQRMADMLGYDISEILGHAVFEFMDDQSREIAQQSLEKRRQGVEELYDFEFVHKDGSRLYVIVNASPLFDEGGRYIGTLGFFSDITARKHAEDELRETRDYLDNLIRYANAPIIVWDPSRRIVRFNRAFEFLTGYVSDEVVGQELAMLFPQQSREESLASIDLALSGEYWESVEIPILRKDGEVRIALWNSANIYAEDGTDLIATIAQGQDITARKQAEEEIKESEGRLHAIADASGDYIIMLDTELRIRFINRVEQGVDHDSIIGTPLYELVDEKDHDRVRTHLKRVVQDNCRREYETVFHRPDGMDIYYSSVAVPLVIEKEVVGVVVNSRDITGRKSMEEALRESEEKFRSSVEQSTDGIVLVDGRGIVIEWNSAMESIMGLQREQTIGKVYWDVLYLTVLPEHQDPETYQELKDQVLGSLERGFASWFGETSERELLSPQGERRIIQIASFPIQSREGMMMGNITRDITRRVQIENDLAYEVEVNKAVAELSSALLSQVSIDDISYVVLENARRLTGSRYGYVGYIETDTGYIICPTLSRDIWEQCGVEGKDIVFSEFTGLWGWVLNNRKPLLTNTPQEDPRSTGVPVGHIPIKRFVSVPALLGGALVGQIALANSDREYTEKDLEVLNRLADLYAMAVLRMWSEGELAEYREHLEELVSKRTQELEKANRQLQEEIAERRRNQEELRATAEQLRALSARVESVREEERRHVAREVHDTLGQSLTGLKINLSLLSKKLADDAEAEDRIASMIELVDTTIQSVREISTQLRPGVIDDLGLAAALDWQLKRFEEMTGLRCSFTSMAEDDFIDKGLAITLFRIAQEALTNIVRHAGASRVEVRLLRERKAILLDVRDDGMGISREEVEARESLGILGMRERANIYGGEVEIRGKRGAGTVLVVRIPVSDDGEAVDAEGEEAGG